ncbi:hypothetical protein [Tenacibaculum sp. 190524A02b]|uniref:hypothetical protein n=1 Tax=Tenacibaculum vairaonense TaxID=3137860 RepID=UPI0031FBA1B8
MSKNLHIISFDNPYPPKYGGVIDVFYKIKALSELGIDIQLHVFATKNTQSDIEVTKYCSQVFYYKRNNPLSALFSRLPYRIKSRTSATLLQRLSENPFPIIYEGLHCCESLPFVTNNKTYVRTHNIEHTYFYSLAKSEKNMFKKCFFYVEGYKLKLFEKHLHKALGIFSIAPHEQDYFHQVYGNKSIYIPAFHEATTNNMLSRNKEFVLYHGDLRVSDNIKAAHFLIDVYKESPFKLIIASSNKESSILNKIKKYANISFKNIPTQKDLNILFKQAHINTLITFQKTGIKLKLLNSLYKGRFVIANTPMIEDTGLENLCKLANTKEQILQQTALLLTKEFTVDEIENRHKTLTSLSPKESAKKIIQTIFQE